MPRYFIDIQHGECHHRDESGSSLSSWQEAQNQAVRILPDIVRDVLLESSPLLDRGRWNFVSTVRDELGRSLFRATLSLSTEWLKH